MGKLKRPTLNSRTDIVAARKRAFALAKALQGGELKAKSDIQDAYYSFDGAARFTFVSELAGHFGQLYPRENESEAVYPKNQCIARTELLWVIVTQNTLTVERDGSTYQFFAQVMHETSTSASVEVYTQAQGGLEAGINFEWKAGPAKFNVGLRGSVVKGIKDAKKDETKDANRSGRTLSRTYVARRVSHEVLFVNWYKDYHGLCEPTGYEKAGLGISRLADRLTYDSRGLNPGKEFGFQVSQNEGGTPWGPFWPDYDPSSSGDEIKNSAQGKVRELLLKLQQKMAEDVASGAAP